MLHNLSLADGDQHPNPNIDTGEKPERKKSSTLLTEYNRTLTKQLSNGDLPSKFLKIVFKNLILF